MKDCEVCEFGGEVGDGGCKVYVLTDGEGWDVVCRTMVHDGCEDVVGCFHNGGDESNVFVCDGWCDVGVVFGCGDGACRDTWSFGCRIVRV